MPLVIKFESLVLTRDLRNLDFMEVVGLKFESLV